MPKVSVIVPTYNRAHFLAEAIQSVLDQTFQDFEVMVVDDGSTDNTKEVVDRFQDPRIKYIYRRNRGLSAARNTGIKASIGEYIALLDSDDIWLPQNLELNVKLLDSRPDIALVCSDLYEFNNDTGATIRRLWRNRSGRYWRELQDGTRQPLTEYLSGRASLRIVTVIMRRQVFDEAGYFDEALQAFEDFDMYVRIFQRFSSIGIINMPLVRVRKHRAHLSRDYDKVHTSMLIGINKIINSNSLSKEHIRFIRRRKLAAVYCDSGWVKIARGEVAIGRERLIAAIRVNPWRVRPYLYLAFSFLGSRPIQAFKSWKRQLEWHKVG
jgi:glycosyltransferase involved in cell wall biosynthesis